MVRFLGCASVANLVVAAVIGFMIYIAMSQLSLGSLLAGIGFAWWGFFYRGCYLMCLATTAKPWNRGQILRGGFFLTLCLAFFVYAYVGISGSDTPELLMLFGAASLVVTAIGYIVGKFFRSFPDTGLQRGADDDQSTTSATKE